MAVEVRQRPGGAPGAVVPGAVADGARAGGEGDLAATAAVAGGVVAHHLVDHLVVPERWHLLTHLAATAAALAAADRVGLGPADVGLDPARLVDGLRWGAAAGAVGAGVVVGVGLAPPTRGAFADDEVAVAATAALVRRGVLDIPLGTAAYEEVVFRGVLLALADRHLPSVAATAAVSAAFGLWHVLPALRDQQRRPATAGSRRWAVVTGTVVATAAAGGGFTALRRRSGSLLAPVLAHAAVNVAALAASAGHARRRAVGSPRSGRGGPAGADDADADAGERP